MKNNQNIIGVDLGGTSIRSGKVVNEKIIQLAKEPTPAEGTHSEVLEAVLGDQAAIQLFSEYGFHLGQAIKSILYAYDPEIIILGGSITKAYDFF